MAQKKCTRCGLVKPYELFRKNARMRCGFDSWCKACIAKSISARRQQIKSGPHKFIASKRCAKCKIEKHRDAFCVERGRLDGLSGICRECRSLKHFQHYAKDPEAWKAKARDGNRRMVQTPSGRLAHRMSAQMQYCLREGKGGRSWRELTGYGIAELKAHLERQFLPKMGWHNMGEWHVDHIVPLASFKYESTDDADFKAAWSLTNLRPLWAKDNVRKHAIRTHLL